jgi:hypothetical protein
MATSSNPEPSKAAKSLAQVAHVDSDDYRVTINRGSEHGIRKEQRFVVFGIGDLITDPATGESLGHLEIVRGVGRVIHVQEKLATIECTETIPGKTITRVPKTGERYAPWTLNPWATGLHLPKVETETEPPVRVPFEDPKVGDFARPV